MNSNIALMISAVIIAIILWLFISINQYPTVPKTIEHIPVTIDISGSTANQNGLSVISCDVDEVTVELLGSRTQIGRLNEETLTAYFDADNVSSSGTKNLTLKIKSDTGINYEVKQISPAKASVVFDKMDTRDFDVSPLTPNVEIAEGKAKNPDGYMCIPSQVQITGPSTQLDRIAKCYAVSDKRMTLDTSFLLSGAELKLYTDDNVLIDKSNLKFSTANFDINISVRTQKKVGLSVTLANTPENFDTSMIKFNMSSDSVTLACDNGQIEIPETLDLGSIPLFEIRPGYSKTFSIAKCLEGSEFINVSDLESVRVTVDNVGLTEMPMTLTLDNSRVKITNTPDNIYDYSIVTQQLNVSVVGSEESISQLTPEDILGEVNLLSLNITEDQFTQTVIFSCPAFDDVWITTNAKATIQRTRTQPTSTASTNSNH